MRTRRRIPKAPVALEEVIERFPTVRQSLLAKFDDCPLSAYFEVEYTNGWTTHPAARGTIFHRTAAECLRTMRAQDSKHIPVGEALVILQEQLEQRDVPPEDRVRVPLREIPDLKFSVAKWASDNEFSIRDLIDVEKQLSAEIRYEDDRGFPRVRAVTGTIDALIAERGSNGETLIAVDWKDTWGIPGGRNGDNPEFPAKNGSKGVSYHAFFQLRLYAWLIMRTYPVVNKVILREFYPRWTEVREASLHRGQLDDVEDMIRVAVREFDRCVATGSPTLTPEGVKAWVPSPGKHCAWCALAARCPIPPDVRTEIAIGSESQARTAAGQLEVVEALRTKLREALRPYLERTGQPVMSRWSKGRRALLLRRQKNGKGSQVLEFKTVKDSDRAPSRPTEDQELEDAMRRSVERAKAERDAA